MPDRTTHDAANPGSDVPGVLRVALLVTNANIATVDPASGEVRGVGAELGKYVAAKLGVTFTPVTYTTPAAMVAGARDGAWDLTFF